MPSIHGSLSPVSLKPGIELPEVIELTGEPPFLNDSTRLRARILGADALVAYAAAAPDRSCLNSSPRVYARGELSVFFPRRLVLSS